MNNMCICVEFPLGCKTYRGPHDCECFRTMWKNVGCLETGWGFANNLTDQQRNFLDTKTIRLVY